MSPTTDNDFVQGARLLREEYGLPNEVEAFRLFKRAAEQRHPNAAFHLGACYRAGMGVVKDDVKAIEWLRLFLERSRDGPRRGLKAKSTVRHPQTLRRSSGRL